MSTMSIQISREAADQLGISTSNLRKWSKNGKIVSSTPTTNETTSPMSSCPSEFTTVHSPPGKRKSPLLSREESTVGSFPGSRQKTSSANSAPYRTWSSDNSMFTPQRCESLFPLITPFRVVAIDPGVRRFPTIYCPEGSATTDGTVLPRYWTVYRGVSIVPRLHWYALYRSTRSRGPRDKAGSRKDRAVPDSIGTRVGITPHCRRPRTSSRTFITKSLTIH